ncbi:hypothetical protein [Aestuariimicrobium kwangyangense]|uniref:hypothetical protein n=1 Tax=Aestuariimicrobium kwangyangense TaxID=396389 RepID=UPI0003B68666|nr:hypothetical protein [Aestuariimicrobium kwangyangense]
MIGQVLAAITALAVLAWLVSPLESLVWWSRRGRTATQQARLEVAAALSEPRRPSTARARTRCYVVYLSGVARYDDGLVPRAERPILERLEQTFGDLRVVSSIYPYSVDNRGLTDDRRSSVVWRFLVRLQGRRGLVSLLSLVINLRNVFQVLVSADERYGPVFSAGVATTIWRQLREAGHRPGEGSSVVLLGWSGGAQIAAGAAWYLAAAGARVHLISLGGVLNADPGIDRVASLTHLVGSRDWQARWLPLVVFPGRRGISRRSSWRRAAEDGRLRQVVIGPFKHVRRGSYLSGARIVGDGRSCSQVTSDAIAEAVRLHDLATDR